MSRSRLLLVSAGFLLAFACAAVGFAQEGKQEGKRGEGRRGGFGGFGGFGGAGRGIDKVTLLGSDQVRTEIKVSGDQAKKVDELLAAHRQASMEIFSSARDLSGEERKKAAEENSKKIAELVKKTEVKLAEALDKEQAKRLDEILLQQQGAEGLVSDNVIASVKLSKEQVEKIKAAIATRDEELQKLRPARGGRDGGGQGGGGRGNFEEIREKSDKLRKDTDAAVLAMLSKEQNESFTKLKGQPLALDRQSLFRGPGGPGGRGGVGGGGPGGRSGEGASKEKKRPAEDGEK